MEQQASKGYVQTESLAKIDEVTEESDEVWLEDQVVEPVITASFRESRDNAGSPLERLVKSISSDGEQWPVDEVQTYGIQPTERSRTKTYYDPTRPTARETREEGRNREIVAHDSDDEINTSPGKRLVQDTENAIAPFTSVVFYRYLFGNGFGSFKKTESPPPELEVNAAPSENGFEMHDENENNDTNVAPSDTGEVAEDYTKTKRAENFPLFVMEKLKNFFSRIERDHMETSELCPLCGNDVGGLTDIEVHSRLKALKTGQVQWLGEKYARLITPSPREVYKTELRIESDGSRSLSESYYRGPKSF